MTAKFHTNKVQYFKENVNGNDYVIGDIHGRYDLVMKALEQVNFNQKTDRLFCVGDLIDRGAYSEMVFDFLQQPYVHAVRGNHEDMLLEIYEEDEFPEEELLEHYADQIGMHWWLDVSEENRQKILNSLKQLPLVIEIETVRGKVGLVHADVPHNLKWEEFKKEVEDNNEHVITETLWGRKRMLNGIVKDIPDVGRVFVGHTVQPRITKLGNVVGIDTGAVFNQHLTIADIVCQTSIIQAPIKTIDGIHVINPETKSLKPFGTGYSSN